MYLDNLPVIHTHLPNNKAFTSTDVTSVFPDTKEKKTKKKQQKKTNNKTVPC